VRTLISSFLAICLLAAGTVSAAASSPGAADSYIVVLRADAAVDAVASRHAAAFGSRVDHVYRHALKGYAATMSASAARLVAADPAVAYVSADRQVRIDAQTLPTGINRIDGELSSTVSGNGSGSVNVDVAVIDTGIDLKHPDLNVYLPGAKNCASGRSANDGHGHGSHVAGTIGALDNGIGVVGVAPGARLWPVRVLNNAGFGSWSGVICGIDWVTEHAGEIEVANMSLGGTGKEPSAGGCSTGDALHDAICRSVAAGVTYAVAAGNESDDAKNHVPAAYDEVITVSALADFDGVPGGLGAPTCRTDQDDTFADFSNFGADIDIIAPGVCILSTWKKGGYNTISGTSMATPHVAGAAALYKSNNPGASPSQVKTALQNAGDLNWNDSDDPDPVKERLLNVDAF
jgi:subtilisin